MSSRIASSAGPWRLVGWRGRRSSGRARPSSQETGICEWIAPNRPPRSTRRADHDGYGAFSFETYQYFVAWLTGCPSRAGRKSANMISITGRRPVTRFRTPLRPARAPRSACRSHGGRRALEQTRRHREHTAGAPLRPRQVNDHAVVALELLVERLADGVSELDLRHAENNNPPVSSSAEREYNRAVAKQAPQRAARRSARPPLEEDVGAPPEGLPRAARAQPA